MAKFSFRHCATLAAALCHAIYAEYTLVDHYSPKNFFDGFNFYTGLDPTNGFVDYVNRTTAHASGLIATRKDVVYIGVDHANVYSTNALGRPSVRLESYATYTHGLFILSLNHMPYACGAWPAFWTLGPYWPSNGEIDVIEGVNTNAKNIATLHSGPNCTIAGTHETGTLLTNNCTSGPELNIGCGVEDAGTKSYGAEFNSAGGGVYAMEWTENSIRTWFFSHGDVPSSIKKGKPDPHTFGKPMANFKGSCDIESSFNDHQLIFDVTFCGDYAGNTYSVSDCPNAAGGYQACIAYVAGNPSAFRNAHWSINYLKAYQTNRAPRTESKEEHKKEQDSAPLHSKQPVAATSKQLSQSLKHAGMGVPPSATRLHQSDQAHTKVAGNVLPDITQAA